MKPLIPVDNDPVQIVTAHEVDPAELNSFLYRMYLPPKSNFLQKHGNWHHGDDNRWVLLKAKKIIGYCAIIPTKIDIHDTAAKALWWVDLIIAPEFRSCGYQTLLDQKIQSIASIKLGFPNELAARIHKKHHWGVREDYEIRLLPLYPSRIGAVHRAPGLSGLLIRLVAKFVSPIFNMLLNVGMILTKPKNALRIETVDVQVLVNIFNRFKRKDMVTTLRDAAHFQWRYLEAPCSNELAFYVAGSKDMPTHYLIARHIPAKRDKYPVTRILDVFGDFQDSKEILELFKLATIDAIQNGSAQVTIMVTLPELKKSSLRAGFWASAKTRFCWLCESAEQMQKLASQGYWVLGDSDNDEQN